MTTTGPATTARSIARVERAVAPSGNRDHDSFAAVCDACGWQGGHHSNRTTEGLRLAERDAAQHVCRHSGDERAT